MITEFPQNNLMSCMDRYENDWAQILLNIFSFVLLKLNQIYKIAFDLTEITNFTFEIFPLASVRNFSIFLPSTYNLKFVWAKYDN